MISTPISTSSLSSTPTPTPTPEEPWYKNLHYCFNFPGMPHRVPKEHCNSLGVPFVNPIMLIPEDLRVSNYKPLHALKLGEVEYVCLICKQVGQGNRQSWNNSNALGHILRAHPEQYPVNLISKDGF